MEIPRVLLLFVILSIGECFATCPASQYMNETGQCSACSPPCKECAVISTNCTDCESDHNISGRTCIPQCGEGIILIATVSVHHVRPRVRPATAPTQHVLSAMMDITYRITPVTHALLDVFVFWRKINVVGAGMGTIQSLGVSMVQTLSAVHAGMNALLVVSIINAHLANKDITLVHTYSWCCNYTCDMCSYSSADHCTSCKQNYYLESGQCNQCPSPCVSCSSINTCTSCKQGYYLASQQCYECPHNCSTCSSTNLCTSCKQGYYLASQQCHECPQNCSTCSSADKCRTCNEGNYIMSDQCVTCSADCKYENCDSNGTCTDGCASSARHGQNCDQVCNSTFPFCSKCNTTSCVLCFLGYYLQLGECAPCTDNCLDSADCLHDNGACAIGCKAGWTGFKCSEKCQENCYSCLQYNPYSCDTCKPGLYGISCQNLCKNCESTTTGPTCSTLNGTCTNGCKVGHWGSGCDKSCSNGCLKRICYQDNGLCFRCEPDQYGEQCDKNCSSTCVDPGNNSNVCRQTDGVCLFGCSPREESQECPRDTYPQTTPNTGNTSDNAGTTIWALSATGIAVIAVVISIATVVIFVRWRKQHVVNGSQKITSEMAGNSDTKGTNEALSYECMEQIDTTGQRQGADNRTATLHQQTEQRAENRIATLHPHPDSSDSHYLHVTSAPDNGEHTYGNSQANPQISENPYMSLDMIPDRDEHHYGNVTPK